ncbi:hypothetical protein O3V59_18335 [Brevibacillus thermoruber]|uniref:DUF2577 domain-containing protein n=1 Tax=Brevibacillus thermoruber TaxID=33942 RepID=A0A9X3TTP2_9BACL|nr:hypothetical protein [Brevibacillus thermoruber]MDA5110322.1 hypothetical protein [Brevibacillus thermoruber]
MQQALQRLFFGMKQGMTDTQVELGTLLSLVPLSFKLDEDPIPLEEEEILTLADEVFTAEHIGRRYALIRCTNKQYLVLGEVSP